MAASALVGTAIASPVSRAEAVETTPPSSGVHDGWYYNWWTRGNGGGDGGAGSGTIACGGTGGVTGALVRTVLDRGLLF